MRSIAAFLTVVALLGFAPVIVALGFCGGESCCTQLGNDEQVGAPSCCSPIVCANDAPEQRVGAQQTSVAPAAVTLAPSPAGPLAVAAPARAPMATPRPPTVPERLASLSTFLI